MIQVSLITCILKHYIIEFSGFFCERDAVSVTILQMKTLKLREVKRLFQGHTASKWWSQDSNPGLSFQEPSLHLFQPQFSPVTQLYQTLCNPMDCSTPVLHCLFHCLSFTVPQSLLKFMPIKSVMPFNHRMVPSIRVFSNESVLCIRWSKYLSFSFSISSSLMSNLNVVFGCLIYCSYCEAISTFFLLKYSCLYLMLSVGFLGNWWYPGPRIRKQESSPRCSLGSPVGLEALQLEFQVGGFPLSSEHCQAGWTETQTEHQGLQFQLGRVGWWYPCWKEPQIPRLLPAAWRCVTGE